MPRAEPSRPTHHNSGKQKGSSKTVKSIIGDAYINNFAVGTEVGPNGRWQSVNHKARGRRSRPREDTTSLASDRSNGSRGATRSVNDGNGSAVGVHAAGVLPGNAHPDSVDQDSVHQGSVDQDINGRRQPSGDTASVASGKSNKSTGTRRSVDNGSGPTRSVHPGPESGHQDTVGGGQAVGDTASVTSRKSSKSTKATKSKPSVRSSKSNHSTGTRRNVDDGNASAGGELPGSVHHDSGGGGNPGAEGLGEEDHGRGEDHDGGEVGGGKDDGGTEVVGEGHAGQGAGTKEDAGTSDAEQAHAGNNNSDLSKHSEEQRAVNGRHVEDDHAGTGERAIIDGDGNGEGNTCPIIVVWEREMSWSLPCTHELPMRNVLYYMKVRRDKEGERRVV